MNTKDIIYYDDEYEIRKKDAGEDGVFEPSVCLDLITIGVGRLKEWHNGGLKNVDDYELIIKQLCDELNSTIEK